MSRYESKLKTSFIALFVIDCKEFVNARNIALQKEQHTGTTRAATRRRTAKVKQKTKCNCVRFLIICVFVNNVNNFAEKVLYLSMHVCRMRTVTDFTSDFSRLRDII